ncbi:MAG: nucleotidyltransferase domain-containing protein [Solirubrobacterales bacterium]
MTTQPEDAISRAALNDTERRAIERIVNLLQSELGEDLLALWLYGSRARGEADPNETHYDRRSDIDMMAIVESGRDPNAVRRDLALAVMHAIEAEGDSPPYYSLRVYDVDWLRDRRRIRSFFFQEVDRDKLILVGGDLEEEIYR